MKLLSSKIFVGYLLVITLLTSLILFFTFRTIYNQYLANITENLKHTNITLHSQIETYFENKQFDEMDKYIKKLGKKIETRITILDPNGVVLADSRKDPHTMENHRNRPELISVFTQGAEGFSNRFSQTVHDRMIYVALPLFDNNQKLIGAIRVSIFYKQLDKLTGRLTYEILQSAFIVVIISLIGVLIFSRTITKPINLISNASRKVASGDFDVKVATKGRDEINELGENFNNMTSRLKALFMEVTSQKDELNTLIKTIQEGLVVFDTNGSILLSNKGFCDIIGSTSLNGANIFDLFLDNDIIDIFNKIVQEKSSFTNEVELLNRFFLCSANFIESKKEVVLLFHDITEIKKLESVKRDFVINVSHELRTPLTAIKGFVETLEDELEGEHSHYIDIVKRHTNRLINIVQDLLLLSELEEPTTKLMTSLVDVKQLIDNVVKIFEQKISEKNLLLNTNIEANFPKLRIDVFRMEQVFVNLIDNAIKYSDSGVININVFTLENFAVIDVKDSGKGISKEDQKRIFERFYIVDKSRSRKVGGTGLGLSIVKHIVLLHEGEISVISNPGEGTTFRIKLPLIKSL